MLSIVRAASAASVRARGALLAIVAAFAMLTFVPSNLLTVQECVTVPKGAGWLGMHFALLRESTACGSGSYAVGGEPGAVLGVALMIAVPILLINMCAAVLALGFAKIVQSALHLVHRVIAAVVPTLPRPIAHVVRHALYVDRRPSYLRPQRSVPPALGRAPPALAIV